MAGFAISRETEQQPVPHSNSEDSAISSELLESSDVDQSDTIGGRIGRAREAAGFTVAQAARRLGVKTATWQGWENDRSEPRSNRLTMIAGTLGVSPAWLLTGFGEGPTEAIDDEVAQRPDVGGLTVN